MCTEHSPGRAPLRSQHAHKAHPTQDPYRSRPARHGRAAARGLLLRKFDEQGQYAGGGSGRRPRPLPGPTPSALAPYYKQKPAWRDCGAPASSAPRSRPRSTTPNRPRGRAPRRLPQEGHRARQAARLAAGQPRRTGRLGGRLPPGVRRPRLPGRRARPVRRRRRRPAGRRPQRARRVPGRAGDGRVHPRRHHAGRREGDRGARHGVPEVRRGVRGRARRSCCAMCRPSRRPGTWTSCARRWATRS